MIERREAILLEVVEKFPSDLVDVYMSGYDIVAKLLVLMMENGKIPQSHLDKIINKRRQPFFMSKFTQNNKEVVQ